MARMLRTAPEVFGVRNYLDKTTPINLEKAVGVSDVL